MQIFMNSHDMVPQPGFWNLIVFFSRLFWRKKTWIIFLLLILTLLSGHLTMPANLLAYDSEKEEEAKDIFGIAEANVEAYKISDKDKAEPISIDHEKLKMIEKQTEFWIQLQTQSSTLLQAYNVMRRYNREPPENLGENWNSLYNTILHGLKQNTISVESDVVLRVGSSQLIEENLYHQACSSLNLKVSSLRPTYSRTQYWRNILSGSHYFSILPFVALILLLHSSFSVDYESGSAKIINSLPVSKIKRNAARLIGQGILATVSVVLIIFLCSFAYPAGEETAFLQGHSRLLHLEEYLSMDVRYTDYVILASSYFLKASKAYALMLLFYSLITMLLSARIKNSLLALFFPITFLLINYMPNYMQSDLGKLPPALSALFSPQMVIEGKASLSLYALEWIYFICCLVFILGIVFSVSQGRRSYVD